MIIGQYERIGRVYLELDPDKLSNLILDLSI